MTSPEYEAFAARMAAMPAPPPDETLVEQRARIDRALGALALAEGTRATPTSVGGVGVIVCEPTDASPGSPVLIYLHGGGFRTASALAYRAYGSHLARACGARVVVVDYRLAPEHPYPAALDDALAVYGAFAADPDRVVVAGDSAGGGLAASVCLRAAAEDLPRPAGLVCCSPFVDLTIAAASYATNAGPDRLFGESSARTAATMYLAGHDPTDPFASPVFGAWQDAPPTLIQASDAEVLLDDARRLATVITDAGGDVTLHVEPGMPHIWPMSYPAFPEAVAAVDQIAAFVRRVTGGASRP